MRQKKSREKTKTPSKGWYEESTGTKTHHCPKLLHGAQLHQALRKRQGPHNDKSQPTRETEKLVSTQ